MFAILPTADGKSASFCLVGKLTNKVRIKSIFFFQIIFITSLQFSSLSRFVFGPNTNLVDFRGKVSAASRAPF